jgi:hypothetical protein
MKKFVILPTMALFFSASFAAAEGQDSIVVQQKSLIEKLDSLNDAVLGLRINGTAKAGVNVSKAKSDQFADNSPTQENQAYTDVNLNLSAHPTSETQIHLEMRLHKDWQNAYDENNNPVIGHWFSYDGSILNNHLDFNLGYMRVGYSPLTLSTPQPELLQEPEIFAEKRVYALSQRNLDTTSRRLMQGINAEYHSGELGIIDDIMLQATGSRMRNIGKKTDQVFFDFDYTDRYVYGGRAGIGLMGFYIGGNYVDAFDRLLSRRSLSIGKTDTVYYEDNRVFSGEIGFNSQKILPNLPVTFGLKGEMAKSNWEVERDYLVEEEAVDYQLTKGKIYGVDGTSDSLVYVSSEKSLKTRDKNEKYGKLHGGSFYVEPFVDGNIAGVEFDLKGQYIQVDDDFWSEMASTPTYRGGAIVLNSNAFYRTSSDSVLMANFGSSSLENLYFSVYNSNTLNASNLLTSSKKNVIGNTGESNYMYTRLDNNYKNAHFYRNGYSAAVLKRLEMGELLSILDPTVDMAQPYGLATPDRKGFTLSLDLKWNDAVSVNGRFKQLEQEKTVEKTNTYTEMAGGLGVDVGVLLNLDRHLIVQGSYAYSEEDEFLKRNAGRVIAGATLDVWGPIAVLAGYQAYERHFGRGIALAENLVVNKSTESLLLGGLRVKIAPLSYVSLQYGVLSNELGYSWKDESGATSKNTTSIDKNVIVADVTVNF